MYTNLKFVCVNYRPSLPEAYGRSEGEVIQKCRPIVDSIRWSVGRLPLQVVNHKFGMGLAVAEITGDLLRWKMALFRGLNLVQAGVEKTLANILSLFSTIVSSLKSGESVMLVEPPFFWQLQRCSKDFFWVRGVGFKLKNTMVLLLLTAFGQNISR